MSSRQAIDRRAALEGRHPREPGRHSPIAPWAREWARSYPTSPVGRTQGWRLSPGPFQPPPRVGTTWWCVWLDPWGPSWNPMGSSRLQPGGQDSSRLARAVVPPHATQRSHLAIAPMSWAESASPAREQPGHKEPSPNSMRRAEPRGIAACASSFPVSILATFDHLGEPQRRSHRPNDRTKQEFAAREDRGVLPPRWETVRSTVIA